MVRARSRGERIDEDAFETRLRLAVGEIVRRQADLGIDVVDDGEFGKPSFVTYVRERLGGLTRQDGERQSPWIRSREALSFPEFYKAQAGAVNARQAMMACTGPITYQGQQELKRDLGNLKAALKGVDVADVFVPSISPSNIEDWNRNDYYNSAEEYLYAIADAMREEYKAIVAAGVTSADAYGTLVTRIDVKLDPKTRDVLSATAENLIVRTDALAPDREQTELIASYEERVKSLAGLVAGTITATLPRTAGANGESVLGGIVADAQLAATRADQDGGAQLAVTNPGGVRTDLIRRDDGTVTYADLFAAQPFNNLLVTLALTGTQIKQLLEQQWLGQQNPRMLQVSKNFSYVWDASRPVGDRIDAASIMLAGRPIDPNARYRVTVNTFLAEGGDGFAVLREGTDRRTGGSDLAALVAWFEGNSPISAGPLDRIRRVN
jgi:5'-nucleotidase, C-terminal domain